MNDLEKAYRKLTDDEKRWVDDKPDNDRKEAIIDGILKEHEHTTAE